MMKAFETRYGYETTEYSTKCPGCMAEVRGDIKDFTLRDRFTLAYTCPACGRRQHVHTWQLKKRTVLIGITELKEGCRKAI